MSTKYFVLTELFAEKHYLKSFRNKKYKKSFDIPWKAFLFMLQKFDLMLEKERTCQISDLNKDTIICKSEFKILPNESAKSSGNRCILSQDKKNKKINILLVYDKNDIQGKSETLWWKKKIKENYLIYRDML